MGDMPRQCYSDQCEHISRMGLEKISAAAPRIYNNYSNFAAFFTTYARMLAGASFKKCTPCRCTYYSMPCAGMYCSSEIYLLMLVF